MQSAKEKSARWVGGHEQTTTWEAASPKQIFGHSKEEKLPHPTQKPLDLMRRPIANHGERGDVVYEPFGGSGNNDGCGATERTRICCCIEIEPRSRWGDHPGTDDYNGADTGTGGAWRTPAEDRKSRLTWCNSKNWL